MKYYSKKHSSRAGKASSMTVTLSLVTTSQLHLVHV